MDTNPIYRAHFLVRGTVVPKARPRCTCVGRKATSYPDPKYKRSLMETAAALQLEAHNSSYPIPFGKFNKIEIAFHGKHQLSDDGDNAAGTILDAMQIDVPRIKKYLRSSKYKAKGVSSTSKKFLPISDEVSSQVALSDNWNHLPRPDIRLEYSKQPPWISINLFPVPPFEWTQLEDWEDGDRERFLRLLKRAFNKTKIVYDWWIYRWVRDELLLISSNIKSNSLSGDASLCPARFRGQDCRDVHEYFNWLDVNRSRLYYTSRQYFARFNRWGFSTWGAAMCVEQDIVGNIVRRVHRRTFEIKEEEAKKACRLKAKKEKEAASTC